MISKYDEVKQRLPELVELERITKATQVPCHTRIIQQVECGDYRLPIYAIDLGDMREGKPSLILVGGIHGIERIGAQVVIAQLKVWLERLKWERSLQQGLAEINITLIPIVNPVGMMLNRRGNGNKVDLMRNSPIESEDGSLLVSGQRFSKWLPWFRGSKQQLEPESLALQEEIAAITRRSPFTLSIDCHSGFGMHDRIWFPYAYRRRPMKDIAPIIALKLLWESSYPNHQYIFEPQSNHYMTHGDLWDYFYKKFGRNGNTFLPLTLEMGSWNWVRKRPLQMLRLEGLFNPLVPHRKRRALRRHLPLMDFLRHATHSYKNWLPTGLQVEKLQQMAHSLWYRNDLG
ncbi:MAG: DUF2817 domain-containing protein [Gammaproteobacteria bacterium]|nr:DUF2817 domain-containing protein [Gammaproteobacteria bacterium]